MTQESILGLIFISACFLGFYIAYIYGRETKRFRWSEYIVMIMFPIICVLVMVYFYGIKILNLFVVSCFAGFFLEYIIGLAYHKTLNKRLWVYDRLSVQGYTSLLSIPLWGIGGVTFWFISKMIGL